MSDDVQFALDDIASTPVVMFHRAIIKLNDLGYYWHETNGEWSTIIEGSDEDVLHEGQN